MSGSEPGEGELVGLVPAAGAGRRVAPLPCSKEIFPLGVQRTEPGGAGGGASEGRPKVAAHYLLERLTNAGVRRVFLIVRPGKWDIPAYLTDGGLAGVRIAYLVREPLREGVAPDGVAFTLDAARPFLSGARVAFGFPDIVFEPPDAYRALLERQASSGADVVLGLFDASRPEKMDMVDLDDGGRVRDIVIKPRETSLRFTWIIAVWTPTFTHFLHGWVDRRREAGEFRGKDGGEIPDGAMGEAHVGNVLRAALDEGMDVASVIFRDGSYVDIGTPRELRRAVGEYGLAASTHEAEGRTP